MEVLMKTKKRPKDTRQGVQRGEKRDERGRVGMALQYAKEDIAVVPMHGTKDSLCTRGDPACDQPGARARAENGAFEASTDPTFIEHLWKDCPNAKIGIPFGAQTRLIGLEIDGEPGRRSLSELIKRNGKLPRTVKIEHLYRETRIFRCDSGEVTKGRLADGLRLLGEGDIMIAPSTLQPRFVDITRFVADRGLGQVKIGRAPQWLLVLAAKPRLQAIPPLAAAAPTPSEHPTIVVVPASEIEPEAVTWIWPGIIARGRITGIVGYPGVGKSQVSIDVAATVSSGRPWPDGVPNSSTGRVIILSAEDDAANTVVPRLSAASAALDAVHLVKAVKDEQGGERPFSLAADLERLEQEQDLTQVRLLIVDPITAYLGTKNGSINRNEGSKVRPVLDHLTTFAARHELGVLAISHLSKARAKAITLVTGSLDWVAVPRAVYLVTEESGTSRRLFLPIKNNLATDRIGFAFELESKVVGQGIQTSAVKWSDDPVTISADEALAASAKRGASGALDFLHEALSDGPMDQSEIVRRGKEAGFTEKSLRTAREKLGVTPKKEGFGAGGKWVWHPAGGAKVLKLVIDNDQKAPAADQAWLDSAPSDDASASANPTVGAKPETGDEPLGPEGPRPA
jgi:hypothetical protein